MRFIVMLPLVLALISGAATDAVAQDNGVTAFSKARPTFDRSSRLPAFFTISIGSQKYVLTWEKKKPDLKDKDAYQHIRVKIHGSYEFIEKLYFAKFRDEKRLAEDIVLAYEAIDVDGERATSFIACIEQKQKKGPKIRWTTSIDGYNLGEPIMRGRYIYVTAVGYVAKIDLEKGKIVWYHDDLFDMETEDFTIFQKPEYIEGKILFYGLRPNKRVYKRLEVDDATGKKLGIYDHKDK